LILFYFILNFDLIFFCYWTLFWILSYSKFILFHFWVLLYFEFISASSILFLECLTYLLYVKFATSELSYFTFFGDDTMLTRGCFSGGCYDNSEIGTLKCFFLVLVDRIERWCNGTFCSTRWV